MKRPTNIEKVAKILNKQVDNFSDKSGQWICFENKDFVITISFDGKGQEFRDITVAQKIYQVVDEKVITTLK